MNRTDRLLGIVLQLQAKGWLRAEDLANIFETSKRTIYRDMNALSETGIPVVSSPGQGFSLVEGYFLPPVNFTADEAVVLLLGAGTMADTFDDDYCRAAQSATTKIRTTLPTTIADAVDQLEARLHFIRGTSPTADLTMLRRIRSAVINQRRLRFTYHTRHVSDDNRNSNRREVDPYGLIHHQGKWYLVAHCHLREGLRNFRLERIDDLETLLQSFQRPADFTLREQEDDRDLIVRVYFDHAITRWVLEEPSFFQESIEHVGDDLLVTYRVRQIDEIKGWLLSWGARARVLEPETLRKALANEAHAILANYESEKSLLP